MSAGLGLKIRRLLVLCTLLFLDSAWSYDVGPNPGINLLSAIQAESTLGNTIQEQPPPGFNAEYQWKTGAPNFDRLDMLHTIVAAAAGFAERGWNYTLFAIEYPPSPRIAIKFVSAKQRAVMQLKHLLWAFERLLDLFVEQQRFAPGNVLINIGVNQVGVGVIKSVQPSYKGDPPMEAVSEPGAEGLNLTVVKAVGNDLALLRNPISTLGQQGNITRSSKDEPLISNGREINAQMRFRPNGHTFPDVQIFNASLKLIIKAAEHADLDERIGLSLSTYNDKANFTYSFARNEFVKNDGMAWLDIIRAISATVFHMTKDAIWAEFDGEVYNGGLFIGRFCIGKGDLTGLEPLDVCPGGAPSV